MSNELAAQNAALPAPMGMAEMQRLAESIAKSRLFGITTADQALTLMAIAQAEGRHPALAARDYHIINGSPAKKAEAMARDFLSAGGRIEWHRLDDDVAEATFSHPAGGSARIQWDQARVTRAGLSGGNHKKYPRQMLRSRVVSEGVRTVWPMATSGMYVPEEVREFGHASGPQEPIDITPTADLDAFAAGGEPERKAVGNLERADLRFVAEQKAIDGTNAFREWWKTLDREQRAALKPDLAEYQRVAEAADNAAKSPGDDEDPFGLPPLDDAARIKQNSPAGADQPSQMKGLDRMDVDLVGTKAPTGDASQERVGSRQMHEAAGGPDVPPEAEQAHSASADAPADLLGDPPSENLTVPLDRTPSAAACDYFGRQLRVLLDEAPRTFQRLARIRSANEREMGILKKASPDLYNELRRELG